MKIVQTLFISIFFSFCTGTSTTTEGDGIRLFMLSQIKPNQTASAEATPDVKPRIAVSSVLKGADSQPVSGARLTYNASGLSSGSVKIAEPRNSDLVTVTTSSTGRYSLTLTTGSFNIDVKSSTNESLGSLAFEVKSVDEVPKAQSEGGKLSNPEVTAKKAPSVNLPSPTSISFTDTTTVKGKLAGLITLKPASDEAAIALYHLYWADELGYKLTEIARFSKTGSDIVYNLSEMDVPTGASKFLFVSANAEGEMDTGASLVFEDK
jgi:hypothetical protein